MDRVLIIGSGSWATALVKIFSENKNLHVDWWVRDDEKAAYINKYGRNPKYLRSMTMDKTNIHASSNLSELIEKNDTIVVVVPSAYVDSVLSQYTLSDFRNKNIISAVKGVEPESLQIMGDYFQKKWNVPENQFGVITGPCHAEEVAQERLSYLTFASLNAELRQQISKALTTEYISVTTSEDIYGTELAAVLKNIYAIAAGIFHSMGYGDNFLAVLVSNAIKEMEEFVSIHYPSDRQINDSAYLGDLLVTAYSIHSRNRTLGAMLGKGYSVSHALAEMNMVAEGYYAAKSMYKINKKKGIKMPISNFVYKVLYKEKSPKKMAKILCTQLS